MQHALDNSFLSHQAFFKIATEGMLLVSSDGVVLDANPGACRILGAEREELIASDFNLFASSDPRLNLALKEQQAVGEFRGKLHLLRWSGTPFLADVSIAGCRTEARKEGLAVIIHKIGECEKPEEDGRNPEEKPLRYQGAPHATQLHRENGAKLYTSEQKYREFFENAVEAMFQSTPDGRLTMVNSAMARVFGYETPQELIASVSDVASQLYVVPDSREEFTHLIEQHGTISGFETRMCRKGGSVIWASVNVRTLHDADGKVAGYEGTVEDITRRKQGEEALRRNVDVLLAIIETGRLLNSTLDTQEVGSRLVSTLRRVCGLTAAVISVRNKRGKVRIWCAAGLKNLWERARFSPDAETARLEALENRVRRSFQLIGPEGEHLRGFCLPLLGKGQVVGVLEAYGPDTLEESSTMEVLNSLANQAGSAMENARLYEELTEREDKLTELIGKLISAQEEERRRVAYEVHDGLAQMAVAAHQRLQTFARRHPLSSQRAGEDLSRVLGLVQQTVEEARRIIANLRPTALDDFGLEVAIHQQVESLRAEGWWVDYEENLGKERLPVAVETALFRVAQEALANTRKHAQTHRIRVDLQRRAHTIKLAVQDWGQGFDLSALDDSNGPGERVGLSGMRERIGTIGGELAIWSQPGEGTSVVANIPLR